MGTAPPIVSSSSQDGPLSCPSRRPTRRTRRRRPASRSPQSSPRDTDDSPTGRVETLRIEPGRDDVGDRARPIESPPCDRRLVRTETDQCATAVGEEESPGIPVLGTEPPDDEATVEVPFLQTTELVAADEPLAFGRDHQSVARGLGGAVPQDFATDEIDSVQPLVTSGDDRAVTDVGDHARRGSGMSIVRRSASVTGSRIRNLPAPVAVATRSSPTSRTVLRLKTLTSAFAGRGRCDFRSGRRVELDDLSAVRQGHHDRLSVVDELDRGHPSRITTGSWRSAPVATSNAPSVVSRSSAALARSLGEQAPVGR